MIISASRRTDIPAFYGEWLVNRLKAGEVLVRNPMNTKQVTRILLSPSTVDCLVFWTKNPQDFIKHLPVIDEMGYKYYFLFTLNPYSSVLEAGVENKVSIIETFKRLSDVIGPQRVIWRYDPIVLTDVFNKEYHFKSFKYLADSLSSYSNKCIISFVDIYKKIEKRLRQVDYILPDDTLIDEIAFFFSKVCSHYEFDLYTCSQSFDFSKYGIGHSKCIDDELVRLVTGRNLEFSKDSSQRDECGCIESRDIGAYNTCTHQCLYCYANDNYDKAFQKHSHYDPHSRLLCDSLNGDERIVDYRPKAHRVKPGSPQGNLF